MRLCTCRDRVSQQADVFQAARRRYGGRFLLGSRAEPAPPRGNGARSCWRIVRPQQADMSQRHQDIELVHLLLKELAGVHGSDSTEENRLADDGGEPERAAEADREQAEHAERQVCDRQLRAHPIPVC